MRRVGALALSLVTAFLLSACAEPPHKEMDQAQGAIDAAQAAGADRYAAQEYRAATDALKQSQDAVAASDYRLALNFALESLEQAQNAARVAADTKAQMRGDIERTMAEVATLMADAHARLAAAERARVPRRLLRGPADALGAVDGDVQKAGEAIKGGDYLAAQEALQKVKERIAATTTEINATMQPPAGRRRR